jgi:hypothetical protein
LKKAQFVYVVHFRLPFCLCKHILGVILEARDEGTAGLPFVYLITQIILQSGINVKGEPRMKMQQPLSKQTLLKSNAQLRREEPDEDILAAMHVGFPDVASSSHTVPPSEPEVNFSQIMEALATLQGGDEQYAGIDVLHAAVCVLHAAGNAVHQQKGGADPLGPSGVSPSPSSREQ